jgi:putative membrane protein
MLENVRKYPVATIIVIAIYFTVGVIGLSLEMSGALFKKLIPVTLLFSLYFVWLFHENPDKRFYFSWLTIFILGFLVEVIGVNTGVIFGEYTYGKTLGFKLWNTPLMIGVNWLLLIYSCRALIGIFTGNRWLTWLAGGALMVLYDIALEPVAIRLDMWNWHLATIPIRNYVAWFIISVIFFIVSDLFIKRIENKIAPAMFIIQFMFFVILNIIFYFI